jgi:hypothetical protein
MIYNRGSDGTFFNKTSDFQAGSCTSNARDIKLEETSALG